MKKSNNIYLDILKYENLLKQFYRIKSSCRNKKMIYNFEINLNQNVLTILKKLYNKNYIYSKYRIFIICKPKYRIIMSENMPDKMVNHLISEYVLLPFLEPKLIDTNVATRKAKGSGYTFNKILNYLNALSLEKKEIFVLKIDIKKYFYRINHEILMKLIKKYIKDQDCLNIIKYTIDTTNYDYINNKINELKAKEINKVNKLNISLKEKDLKINEITKLPIYQKGKGLPIGNMTSQILAIFYLNEVDHYIKEDLKCKYYIRYMDDLVILDNDYQKLVKIFKLIEKRINKLDLEINTKSNIYKVSEGFSFLGYTFKFKEKLQIKCFNKTYYRIKRHLRKLKKTNEDKHNRSVASYKGYFNKVKY